MKRVIVLRGLPGSGKSTHARGLGAGLIVSADDLFMVDGEYRFDPRRLPEAHGSCFKRFLEGLAAGVELVVVDNTNTTAVEAAPYVLGATAYGYRPLVRTIGCDPEVAAARNVHGVPREVVLRMAVSLGHALPPWWASETIRGW